MKANGHSPLAMLGLLFGCALLGSCVDVASIDKVSIECECEYMIPGANDDKPYLVTVKRDGSRSHELWPEEWFEIRTKDGDGSVLASNRFYSSYGMFHLDVVDLDGDGKREYVFILGDGRGTSARRETLFIYRLTGGRFASLYQKAYSDYYGPGLKWWYNVEYIPGLGNSRDLKMSLKKTSPHSNDRGDVSLIPKESVIILHFEKE